MNSEENKTNPHTPSTHLALNEQLMYKLASLDAAVQMGFRRLDEKMDRFQNDLHENQITTNDRISELDKEFNRMFEFKRARIDGLVKEGQIYKEMLEKRLTEIETWQKVSTARIGILMGAIVTVWTFIAPTLRDLLGVPNI